MTLYLRLFWEFFKTGLFSVGGGMATVPFLQDISARTGWFTFAELADMIAVGESTPGPIGVNMATYVGYTTGFRSFGVFGGLLGSIIATAGLVLPSLIVILIIAAMLDRFRTNRYVDAAFYGLRPASVGLVGAAGVGVLLVAFFKVKDIYGLFQGISFDWKYPVLAAVLLYLTRWCKYTKKLHPIYFIALSAVVGIIFAF